METRCRAGLGLKTEAASHRKEATVSFSNKKFQYASILFVCWFASYLERFLINLALPYIGTEFKIDESGLGLLLSVFFLGYALVQLPGGLIADKIGTRKTILFSVGMFAVFTAASGLAWSLTALFVIRFLFGIFEGRTRPSPKVMPRTNALASSRSCWPRIRLASSSLR
jgi:MFS family permease